MLGPSNHVRLWTEVKQLVTEKKPPIWNEVVDMANSNYGGNKKEFWALVGRRKNAREGNCGIEE